MKTVIYKGYICEVIKDHKNGTFDIKFDPTGFLPVYCFNITPDK